MRCVILVPLVLCGSFCGVQPAARAGAESAPLKVAYGNGVHAYHGGDFQLSYDELTGVVEAGSTDPRVFYFRGLAALKLGRSDEAEADFQQGANLEASGAGGIGTHFISRALERVQGCDRRSLEQYRSRARVAALQRDREATRRRYSDIEEAEADVLRRRRPERNESVEPVRVPAPKAAADEGTEPAAEETEKPAADGTEPAAPAAKPADAANPFADDPAER